MVTERFSPRGCDALDLAAVWPCGPQIGCMAIPAMDSPAGEARQRRDGDKKAL